MVMCLWLAGKGPDIPNQPQTCHGNPPRDTTLGPF